VGGSVSYKFLFSFHVWFRGTGRGFGSAPLQKHKRCALIAQNTTLINYIQKIEAKFSRAESLKNSLIKELGG